MLSVLQENDGAKGRFQCAGTLGLRSAERNEEREYRRASSAVGRSYVHTDERTDISVDGQIDVAIVTYIVVVLFFFFFLHFEFYSHLNSIPIR